MKNLVMFHGSCGHTTVEEVSDETWTEMAVRNRTRIGRRTRMVYVVPWRYCLCLPCIKLDAEEL